MFHLILSFILLAILVVGHLFSLDRLTLKRENWFRQSEHLSVLPAPLVKLMSLDYQNLVADLIFSRTLSFYGGRVNQKDEDRIDPQTWQTIYKRLDLASQLDPYFVDPYYFAQAVLTWNASMPKETNALLDRGRRFRSQDWIIPFFMGFNAFYFLQDYGQASLYLTEASQRPGSPPFLPLLAARMATKGGETQTAVAFLRHLEMQTEDQTVKEQIRKRLLALEGIWFLEQAVEQYRQKFGKFPETLEVLVKQGMISQIPTDPYGGEFYLDSQGKIWTTSDLTMYKRDVKGKP